VTVIVTGASRGIGRVVAERLHSLGYEILGISTQSIRDKDYQPALYDIEECDVSDIESVRSVYQKIKHKKIVGLINCAGIFESAPFNLLPYERYSEVILVNLLGTINTCSVFLKLMDKDVHTPIINMSSIAAHIPNSNTAYTASKSGVEGFTASLAKDLCKTKIRPNAICPSVINTDMAKVVFENNPNLDQYLAAQPIGIQVTASDIADIVELLFDPKSNCIGGQSIQIG
jgi:NAD(P)-dependent dehydrogenase (short-subunit alcohol dehydrogenase family)